MERAADGTGDCPQRREDQHQRRRPGRCRGGVRAQRHVEEGARGVSAIFVPMTLPGITRTRFDCHGQRAIGRGSIHLRERARAGRPPAGPEAPASCR
jgi:hypothetical protein